MLTIRHLITCLTLLLVRIGLVFFLAFTSTYAKTGDSDPFFSIDKILTSIKERDLGNHRSLSLEIPSTYYHWISINSLDKLFSSEESRIVMPLKKLGSDNYPSLLTQWATGLKDEPGLYLWHNPVGGASGGTNEMYGNNEAILTLEINTENIKVGLVVVPDDGSRSPNKRLLDPNLESVYDLILHVRASAYNGKFYFSYIEWVLLNPNIVKNATANPINVLKVMRLFRDGINKIQASNQTNRSAIGILAGTQHNPLAEAGIDQEDITKMEKNLIKFRDKIPTFLTQKDPFEFTAQSCRIKVKGKR